MPHWVTKGSRSVSIEICPGYNTKIQLSKTIKIFSDTCSHKSIFIRLRLISSLRKVCSPSCSTKLFYQYEDMHILLKLGVGGGRGRGRGRGRGKCIVPKPKMQSFQNKSCTTILLHTILYMTVLNSCYQWGILMNLSVNLDI